MTATLRPRRIVAPAAKRLLAAAIDLAIIGLPTLAVTLIATERFRLLAPGEGPSRFAPSDRQRVDELADVFHRAVEWNGWLYVLDGDATVSVLGALALLALLTLVAVPTSTGGRTPGKLVIGLRVVAADGGQATAGQHLVRAMAGPIDLLPVVIPGLVGTIAARTDRDRRRLGDRLAQTRVTAVAEEWVLQGDATPDAEDLDSRPQEPEEPDQPTIILTEAEPEPEPELEPGTDEPTAPSDDRQPPTPAPPLQPVRHLDGSATRSPRSNQGGARTAITLDRSVGGPEAGWLGRTTDYDAWDAASDAAPTPTWRTITPTPHRPFDALLFPESSLAEAPMVATVLDDVADTGDDGCGFGPGRPMWDELRRAWAYRDRATGQWYRHDATSDRWVPIVD